MDHVLVFNIHRVIVEPLLANVINFHPGPIAKNDEELAAAAAAASAECCPLTAERLIALCERKLGRGEVSETVYHERVNMKMLLYLEGLFRRRSSGREPGAMA